MENLCLFIRILILSLILNILNRKKEEKLGLFIPLSHYKLNIRRKIGNNNPKAAITSADVSPIIASLSFSDLKKTCSGINK